MQIKEEHIINLVIDYSKGELSNEGKKELENFCKESVENQKKINHYRRLYHNGRSIGFLKQVNEEKAWNNISNAITKPTVKTKTRKLHLWVPYAAAVAIIAFVSTFLILQESNEIDFSKDYNFAQLAEAGSKKAVLTLADGSKVKLHEQTEQQISEEDGTQITKDSANNITYLATSAKKAELLYNTIDVPRGGEYSLTLSDGTKVWLNAETELRYPVNFLKNKRDVYLVGEAYFEVAHNKEAPFTVHTHDTKVKVLGTKFNISGYEDQEFIATTLVEGSVQVNNLESFEILEPGYQSTVIRGQEDIDVKEVDTHLYTSWVNGVYEFENMEMEYIMAQLGRWYDVKFFFTEEQYKHIRFTGAFKKDNSFEFALDMIERIADVDFAIKGKHIVIGRQ